MKKFTFLTALLLSTSTFAQVPNYVSTNGLVGWWPFNGNANDESGNGNNGTVNGATLTSDRNGITNKAYSFDGNGDFINCGNLPSVNITGNVSISVWLKISDFNNDHGIVSKSGLYDLITNSNNSNPPLDKIRWNAGNSFLFSGPSIQLNQWIHITSVYNHLSGHEIYMNGILVSSDNITGSVQPNTTYDLYLGSHQPFNVNYWSWSGKLDDIGIWNRALTQQEITNLYNGVYNLPVELTQFSASCSENTTNINWQTASEKNSAYFEVFKSRDGEVWTSKTTTPAAGNSTSTIDYSFTDYNEASLVYYKLKQVDKDGQYKEYGPISANCNENTSLFISPNPTNGEFNLIGMEHFGTITSLDVKDATGKVVKAMQPTTTQFTCNELKAGVYFLTVTSNKTEQIIKIIKE
jgi:hypothetical protein